MVIRMTRVFIFFKIALSPVPVQSNRFFKMKPLQSVTVPSQETFCADPNRPGVQTAAGYAGDISCQLAWVWVQSGEAVLVDVRTDAERAWVGVVPQAVAVAWKQWPGMISNASFDAELLAAVPADKKLMLLCRSGVRSVAAARRATELGLQAYNILEGFEGDPDESGQRSRRGGWRFQGLPWHQG